MSKPTKKCDRKKCGREHFRNELKEEELGGIVFTPCPQCHRIIMEMLASKGYIGNWVRGSMPIEERNRLRIERGKSYARSDFNVEGMP